MRLRTNQRRSQLCTQSCSSIASNIEPFLYYWAMLGSSYILIWDSKTLVRRCTISTYYQAPCNLAYCYAWAKPFHKIGARIFQGTHHSRHKNVWRTLRIALYHIKHQIRNRYQAIGTHIHVSHFKRVGSTGDQTAKWPITGTHLHFFSLTAINWWLLCHSTLLPKPIIGTLELFVTLIVVSLHWTKRILPRSHRNQIYAIKSIFGILAMSSHSGKSNDSFAPNLPSANWC